MEILFVPEQKRRADEVWQKVGHSFSYYKNAQTHSQYMYVLDSKSFYFHIAPFPNVNAFSHQDLLRCFGQRALLWPTRVAFSTQFSMISVVAALSCLRCIKAAHVGQGSKHNATNQRSTPWCEKALRPSRRIAVHTCPRKKTPSKKQTKSIFESVPGCASHQLM